MRRVSTFRAGYKGALIDLADKNDEPGLKDVTIVREALEPPMEPNTGFVIPDELG